MLKFNDYLKEDYPYVFPWAMSDGRIDIEDVSVRDQINMLLSIATNEPSVTPYNTLMKVRKALAYFHIQLPKRAYMEGAKGVEVWNVMQFGDKMGMTNDGEFVKTVPSKFYLFFSYRLLGHTFMIRAKLVTKAELEKEIAGAEAMMEGIDADSQLERSKSTAPKEEMKKLKGKAVAVSDKKKVDEEHLEEISKGTLASYIKKSSDSRAQAQADTAHYLSSKKGNPKVAEIASKTVQKRRRGIRKAADKLAKEEYLDEISSDLKKKYSVKAKKEMLGTIVKRRRGMRLTGKDWKNFAKRAKGVKAAEKE